MSARRQLKDIYLRNPIWLNLRLNIFPFFWHVLNLLLILLWHDGGIDKIFVRTSIWPLYGSRYETYMLVGHVHNDLLSISSDLAFIIRIYELVSFANLKNVLFFISGFILMTSPRKEYTTITPNRKLKQG